MDRMKFEKWINRINIIIDSQEKKINHIKKGLDDIGVEYSIEKLSSCDYTYNFDGMPVSSYIERKNSLDEISVNFTTGREKFRKEFDRMRTYDRKYVFIENATIDDVFEGNFKISKINKVSFLASMLAFQEKYNITFKFVKRINFVELMLRTFYYNFYYDKDLKHD